MTSAAECIVNKTEWTVPAPGHGYRAAHIPTPSSFSYCFPPLCRFWFHCKVVRYARLESVTHGSSRNREPYLTDTTTKYVFKAS